MIEHFPFLPFTHPLFSSPFFLLSVWNSPNLYNHNHDPEHTDTNENGDDGDDDDNGSDEDVLLL